MKITVDTNILISATFWHGDSNEIIQKVERKDIELILSNEIIKEFGRVLNYKNLQEKIKNKNLEMKRTMEKLVSIATLVEPDENLYIVKDDPDDNKILECAKTGKVDFIISNDNHLLKLEKLGNIPIVTPQEFLNRIKKLPEN